MSDLEVAVEPIRNTLNIKIEYPRGAVLSFNFKLIIQVLEQNILTRSQKKVYQRQFLTQQKQLTVEGLQYSKNYKVVVRNSFGREMEMVKNVFAFTKAQQWDDENIQNQSQNISQSESSLSRHQISSRNYSSLKEKRNEDFGKSFSKGKSYNPNIQLSNSQLLMKTVGQSSRIAPKQKLHKYLLQGRKCRNIEEFINEKEGRKRNRDEVMNKKMLVVKGKLLMSEIYKYREGCKLFQNDWCMGPFYSYNANESQMRRQ